jgi:hypothetical protein
MNSYDAELIAIVIGKCQNNKSIVPFNRRCGDKGKLIEAFQRAVAIGKVIKCSM